MSDRREYPSTIAVQSRLKAFSSSWALWSRMIAYRP